MKRFSCLFLCVCFLYGCSSSNPKLEKALEFRNAILSGTSCSFIADISATIDDDIYTFKIDCTTDSTGKLEFAVLEPESIAGICGEVSDSGTFITFDDVVLGLPQVADGRLNPVSSPWVFINSLRSGYLTAVGESDDGFTLSIDDSYEEDSIRLNVYTSMDFVPNRVEMFQNGICFLTMQIRSFQLQ